MAGMMYSSSGKFDFELYDGAEAELAVQEASVHSGFHCAGCGRSPVVGVRYQCANCPEYSLCAMCEVNADHRHDKSHLFLKLVRPVAAGRLEGVLLSTPPPQK